MPWKDVRSVLAPLEGGLTGGESEMAPGLVVGMTFQTVVVQDWFDVRDEINFLRRRRRQFGDIHLTG